MKIVKEYNLLVLSSVVKRAIETSYKVGTKNASIDIIKAQEIVEVLERMAELEGIQKEADGYVGEYGCIGYYDRSCSECLNCDRRNRCKEIKERREKCDAEELEDNRKCFGACVEDDYLCTHCADYEKCLKATDYDTDDEEGTLSMNKTKERNETLCNDCLMSCCCHVDCKSEHITKQMLGDLVKCFGKFYGKNAIVVCGTCKYKEQCEVLTKHE